MKCGTTVLWHNLRQHPDIFMGKNPDDPKKASTEIRFWNNGGPHHTWKNKGIEWYKGLFNGICCGEKSANYVNSNIGMKRIAEFSPKSKLIICMRDPVFRAYSEYQMQLHTSPGKWKQGFGKAVKNKDLPIIRKGQYIDIINENVLPFFSRDNIIFSIQERMKINTQEELNGIYSDLGLSAHNCSVKKVPSKERDKRIDSYKNWSTNYTKPIKSKHLANLKEYYKIYNNRLFDFLGYEISEWA